MMLGPPRSRALRPAGSGEQEEARGSRSHRPRLQQKRNANGVAAERQIGPGKRRGPPNGGTKERIMKNHKVITVLLGVRGPVVGSVGISQRKQLDQ